MYLVSYLLVEACLRLSHVQDDPNLTQLHNAEDNSNSKDLVLGD